MVLLFASQQDLNKQKMRLQKRRLLLAGLLLCYLHNHAQSANIITLTLNTKKTYQTIDNFAASDAWSCQFVGNWPSAKKNAIADWLFSMDTAANGAPKGIGLSMWRYNLGAGSTQQGDASGIGDEWKRAASFLEANGTYNFNNQAGQQWFLTAAKQRGVAKFLAFVNSPNVRFTKNNKAFAEKGISNLDSNQYKNVALDICKSLEGLRKNTGVTFDYISPVNEPQWDWSDDGQEGAPYTNKDVSALTKVLSNTLREQKLSTKILLGEAGLIAYLFMDYDKPGRGSQVRDFMDASSPLYVGNVKSVAPVISAHSYFTTSPYAMSIELRKQLTSKIDSVKGLSYWQSEYCILGDNNGEINGEKRDTGMTAALYLARVIHTDLAVANAAAWQWWLSVSPFDYKDGLIYIDQNKADGNYYDSKMLWAFGNYSRFVRPGMKRIELASSQTDSSLLASAYIDQKQKTIVVVVVNSGKEKRNINLQGLSGKSKKAQIETYTTDATRKLAKQTAVETVVIDPQSVATLVIHL
jgi:hypothetical protein